MTREGTTATWNGKDKKVFESGTHKLVDKVMYKDLVINQEYTITGYVVLKENGEQITKKVSVKFTPTSYEGFLEVTFDIDTSKFATKELVVFEELFDKNNNLLAEHKDLNDEGQSVIIKKIQKKDKIKNPETGGRGVALFVAMTIISTLGLIITFITIKNKKG